MNTAVAADGVVMEAGLSAEAAREITARIRVALEGVHILIVEAYRGRAWAGMGYRTWDAYCKGEFGNLSLQPPLEERQQTLQSLREAGLSLRAIAAATQLGRGTVARGLSLAEDAGVPDGTPAEIVGTDGKTYPRRPPKVIGEQSTDPDLEVLLDMSPEEFGIGVLTPKPLSARSAAPRRSAAKRLITDPLPKVVQLAGTLLTPGGLAAEGPEDAEVLLDLGTSAAQGILTLSNVLASIDGKVLRSGTDRGAALAADVRSAMDELRRVLHDPMVTT
jgi:hypothetical protein